MYRLDSNLGEITSDSDRGKYSSRLFQNFNITYFLGILALIIVLGYWDTIETFQVIICVGCLFGFIAAYNVLQVPESSTPKISATVSVKGAIAFLLNYRSGRKLIWGSNYIFYRYNSGFALFDVSIKRRISYSGL